MPSSNTGASAPLKILQVGSSFPGWGGTEIHLLNLSEQLQARGHQVTISCRPGKYVEEQAQKRGLNTASAIVKRPHDFRNAGRIWRLLRSHNFDVVHAHWFNDYLVTPLLARAARVPAVFISHHSPYLLKPFAGRLYQPRLCNRIVALSESVRQTLIGQGVPGEKVVTIHHGIDTSAFRQTTRDPAEIRAEWNIPSDAFVVGMAGRIGEEKGIFTFIEALKRLQRPAYAVLIGDGPREAEARERAKEAGLLDNNRLVFAGFRSDVNEAINALDVHVPASTWAEPCAAVVQQAMALSKPVIGTNIGGTPEMVAHEQTGLLVPPGDAGALADAVTRLADDPQTRAHMGAAGRERADRLFTQTVMANKNETLYRTTVANEQR